MKTKFTLIIALLISLISAAPALCEESALRSKCAYNTNGDAEYIGNASSNRSTSDTGWKIQKIFYDGSGNYTGSSYPNGDSGFNYVWDDRESYTYPD